MRIVLRAGGILGGAGFVALYALQTEIALLVTAGIPLVGLLAGLAAAKWLPREEYGRQFRAGLRAGMLASGLAALGALLSLLTLGPRDITTLATRSHIASFSVAPVARALAFLTWAGVDIVVALLAAALGCGLAAVAAQVVGWSKSAEAVRVVEQARLAARALNREDAWQPRSTGAPLSGQPIHASTLLAQLGAPALGAPSSSGLAGLHGATGAPILGGMPGPISGGGMSTGITPGLGLAQPLAFTPASGTPTTAGQPALPSRPANDPELVRATEPALPAVPSAQRERAQGKETDTPGKRQVRRRSSSSRRRADQELTQAMRDALAAWASESAADEASTSGDHGASRAPASSEYLNSAGRTPASAGKRGRKKQDTRDWLC